MLLGYCYQFQDLRRKSGCIETPSFEWQVESLLGETIVNLTVHLQTGQPRHLRLEYVSLHSRLRVACPRK